MDEYDLARLTDVDFENVCKDLFEEHLGVPLEIFARGSDGGIDLRYEKSADAIRLVVQCKHWIRTGRAKLIKHFEGTEAKKARALEPSNYILAASVDLTPHAKSRLVDLIGSDITDAGSLYGAREIVSILARHSGVVRRNFRLWLSSTAMLQAVLHQGVLHRSNELALDIKESMQVYVPNYSFDVAQSILEREHLCIIAGLPGIGKTTLARVLSASAAESGFEIVDVTNRLTEIHDIWSSDSKQLFYVDDFLGQVMLNHSKLDDASDGLRRLLRSVNEDPTKRVVLTTREYILVEARQRSDKLDRFDFEVTSHVVDLGSYNRHIRAEILYNHVYFSKISDAQKAEFADRWMEVVEHRGYSPRLIEHALVQVERAGDAVSSVKTVLKNLNNPVELWETLVTNALSVDEIAFVVTLFACGERPALANVEAAWRGYLAYNVDPRSSETLRRVLRRLDGTMIKTHRAHENSITVEFHNPSARDYMLQYVSERPEVLRTIVANATFLEQVQQAWRIGRSPHGVALGSPPPGVPLWLWADALNRLFDQNRSISFGCGSAGVTSLRT